jgi:dynein heavy chain, axonemal
LIGGNGNKTACIFIDDVNMPDMDSCGTQMPIELLRQLVDKIGFYNRKGEWFWKSVSQWSIIAAAAPPGGGRKELTT